MTGCVSYFAATLTDTLGPAPFQDPQVSFFTSLGLCFEGRVDSSLLYIYIWDVKSMSADWKLLLVISNGWKKGQSKDPPQGETLGASDTFNIQEKRYWFLGLNEQARKFGLKTIKNRQNERRNRKLFFIDPAAARYGTTPVVAESQVKFNSILK